MLASSLDLRLSNEYLEAISTEITILPDTHSWYVGRKVGRVQAARSIVDEKGRIIVPKPLRSELGIAEGSQVSVQVEKERLVVSKVVEADEFIRDMEGFVKEGSKLPLVDPLSLKRIWEKA